MVKKKILVGSERASKKGKRESAGRPVVLLKNLTGGGLLDTRRDKCGGSNFQKEKCMKLEKKKKRKGAPSRDVLRDRLR